MKKRLCLSILACLICMLLLPTGPVKGATTYKVSTKKLTLSGVGKKSTLKLKAPKKAKVTWKSSNKAIVTVTSKGVVTAKKKGTATITCKVKKGSVTKKLTCKVTVKGPAYALSAKTLTLNGVGKKSTIKLTAPKKSKASWKSSNKAIATVSSKGVVTAKKRGTVTITCQVKKGSVKKKLTCKVTVLVPAKAIQFTNAVINKDCNAHVIKLGTTYNFNYNLISSSTKSTSTDVAHFYVGDPSIATVDAKSGVVTPKKQGYTTLTVCCGPTTNKVTVKQTIRLYITNLYVYKAYRNGNSIVAEFYDNVKTPGYLTVDGIYVSGELSENNKKEVIYNISNHVDLLNRNTTLPVNFCGYSAFNETNSNNSSSCMVNFGAPTYLPVVTSSTFTTKKINGVPANILTLTYNNAVTLTTPSGHLNAISNIDGTIGPPTLYAYTATASGNTVTITLTDSFAELGIYSFTIPDGFVMDSYYNKNSSGVVQARKMNDAKDSLPAPSSIQIDGTSNEYVYVTFPTMVDGGTAGNPTNYSISGVSVQGANVESNDYNTPTVVKLTVKKGDIKDGVIYQVKISGIKGYKGTYTTMEEYTTLCTLSNYKALMPISAIASASGKTATIIFSQPLVTQNCKIDYKVVNTGLNTEIEQQSVAIESNRIIIRFKGTLTSGTMIELIPTPQNNIQDVNGQTIVNTKIRIPVSN